MDMDLLKPSTRPQYRPLWLTRDISLSCARVHECAGKARHHFALISASHTQGPVLWISFHYQNEQVNPCGIAHIADPSRFVFIRTYRKEDLLWSMEEALRSGAVSLVIGDLDYIPALTPVRRLQLAAEAGAHQTGTRPLGLLLTPHHGGAQGVETRWICEPAAQSQRAAWKVARTKSRYDPPKAWLLSDNWQNSVECADK